MKGIEEIDIKVEKSKTVNMFVFALGAAYCAQLGFKRYIEFESTGIIKMCSTKTGGCLEHSGIDAILVIISAAVFSLWFVSMIFIKNKTAHTISCIFGLGIPVSIMLYLKGFG